MRAGSSFATIAFVRRNTTGRSARDRSSCADTPVPAGMPGRNAANARVAELNVVAAPNMPGLRNSNRLHSSSIRFSIGVPLNARR